MEISFMFLDKGPWCGASQPLLRDPQPVEEIIEGIKISYEPAVIEGT
jgi:hypothetical protein